MHRWTLGSLILLGSGTAMAGPALDGVFYPDWGDNGSGTVSTKFVSDPFDYWENINDVVALPDGSSIVVGTIGVADDIGLLRLTPKGEPDPAFGIGGFATVQDKLWLSALDATLDKNGMLLLAGSREDGPFGSTDFAVCRVNPATGAPVTFTGGTESCVAVEFAEKAGDVRRSQANNVVVLANGDIVLTGNLFQGETQELSSGVGAMAKLKPNGSLDPGFGTGGKRTYAAPQSVSTGIVKCAGATNGKIVCAIGVQKTAEPITGYSKFLRFDAQGVLEANWSGGDDIFADYANRIFAEFALVDNPASAEDDIVAFGGAGDENMPVQTQTFVTRILGTTGNKDIHFGTNGVTTFENLGISQGGFVVQPGIGFIIAGSGLNMITASRFHFDGSVDTAFGKAGSTEIGNPDNEVWFSSMRASGDALYLVGIHTGVADPNQGFKPQSGPPTPKTKLIAGKLMLDGIFDDTYED